MKTDIKPNSTIKLIQTYAVIIGFLSASALSELYMWLAGTRIKVKLLRRTQRNAKYGRMLLDVFNMTVHQPEPVAALPPGLIVCNHLSYTDILVIASTYPGLFVTSMEVRNTPGAGWISRLAGCLFVERRSREKISSEVRSINLVLGLGTSVVVFPEATSSNGQSVLPFKAAMYQAAIDAQVPIHQLCIRYRQPEVAYYGDMTLGRHIFDLLKLPRLDCTLQFVGSLSEPHSLERFEIAKKSFELVQHAYLS